MNRILAAPLLPATAVVVGGALAYALDPFTGVVAATAFGAACAALALASVGWRRLVWGSAAVAAFAFGVHAFVPVPLLPGDKDVTLDLQLALTNIYDIASYDLVLDYTKPPDVPLEEKAAQWAAILLKNQSVQ